MDLVVCPSIMLLRGPSKEGEYHCNDLWRAWYCYYVSLEIQIEVAYSISGVVQIYHASMVYFAYIGY